VTIFRELRNGVTADGKTKVKAPSGTLSTAEAISVINSGLAMAGYYGDGTLRAGDMAAGLTGAIVKDPVQDRVVWLEYLQTVVKDRSAGRISIVLVMRYYCESSHFRHTPPRARVCTQFVCSLEQLEQILCSLKALRMPKKCSHC